MKLLRLLDLSAKSSGSLSFSLNEPMTLHPESQVCLQECTLDALPQQLIVTTGNQTVNFSTKAANGAPQTAFMTPGLYSKDEIILELTRALNAGLDVTVARVLGNPGSASGMQWQASSVNDKTVIAYDRNDPAVFPPQSVVGGTLSANLQTLTKTDTTTTGFTCWALCQRPIIWGAGYFCVELVTGATGSVCLGLNTSRAATAIDPATLQAAIFANITDQHYYVQNGGGALVDTGVTAVVGDLFGFRMNLGTLEIIYRRGVNDVVLAGPIAGANAPYFPVMAIEGPAGATATLAGSTGATGAPNTSYHSTDPFYASAETPEVGAKPTTDITLHFENPLSWGAADLLGYQRVLQRTNKSAGSFTSTNDILSTPERLSLAVLLDSMPSIQAFDSSTGGRRPILATISAWLEKDGTKIEYQPANLNWIDIDNPGELSLSTFRIRVVDTSNQPIGLGDGCCFTLLFK